MSLSIQRLDDFVEAHEIADEWQILAIACLIRVCECSSNDIAKFANVAHVKATHSGIKRKSPTHGSVCLLLRSERAHKILVVARRDDERMMRDPGILGSAYRCRCLLKFVGAFFPKIGDQKDAMRLFKCSFKGFRSV